MMTDAITALNDAEIRQIEDKIAEVETHTSAEIVCAIATESGRYDRAEAFVGLIGSLACLGLAKLFTAEGGWASTALAYGWQALAVVVGFIVGHLLASYWRPLRHLFIRRSEIDAEVDRAAWHVFGSVAIRGTTAGTGLLIYLSLCERRLSILADERARQALGPERIAQVRDSALAAISSDNLAAGCLSAIEDAGKALATILPADSPTNPNELADHLLLYHPRPGDAEPIWRQKISKTADSSPES